MATKAAPHNHTAAPSCRRMRATGTAIATTSRSTTNVFGLRSDSPEMKIIQFSLVGAHSSIFWDRAVIGDMRCSEVENTLHPQGFTNRAPRVARNQGHERRR